MTIDDIHDSIRLCDQILEESHGEKVGPVLNNIRIVHGRLKEILNHWESAHLVPHE
jgi:hypothetical protein